MTPSFNPYAGGVQRTTWKLGKYFSENGYQVAYYSLNNKGHVDAEFGVLFSSPETGIESNPVNITDLKEKVKAFAPDVVINQMPYVNELRDALSDLKNEIGYALLGCLRNSLFSFKSNARDIMQQQLPRSVFKILDNPLGMWLIQKRHKWKHARDLRSIIDQHDYFILLSPPNRKELEYFVGDYKSEKVAAIPNSIPEVQSEDILDEKERIILHVGRINIQQKRSDLLAEFWEHLNHKLPDWKFIIVGDGPYFKQLRKEIAEKNLSRIYLEGYQKPEPYYRKASVFIMPSAFEGFPNTLLEAQSFGCAPVMFHSYAALDWVVKDGKDGILVKPFETKKMAEHTVALIQDEDKLRTMQQESLKNASQFTIHEVGKIWVNFFDNLDQG